LAGGDWRRLPTAALGLPEQAEAGLRRAGLKLLADIARQPRSTVAARFGMAALTALDRLEGSLVRPLAPRRSRPALRFEQRLAEPVLTADGADAVLETLYARAARRLQRLGLGGRRFVATLNRADGAVHTLAVDSGRPIRDAGAIARLFAERIAGLADPLDPGFGYDCITLSVPRTEPLGSGQPGLEPTAGADAEDLADLIDRLSIRFGPDRLLRLHPVDSNIPERAGRRPPARDAPPPAWPVAEPAETPLRPMFLLDPPESIDVLAEVPDGPPHRFRWRRVQHRVALAEGPERIAPDWWRQRSGALTGGRSRDYWRVEDSDGHRFWLFRAGFYEDGERPPGWYMHGLFA
jgi:protein ImuB